MAFTTNGGIIFAWSSLQSCSGLDLFCASQAESSSTLFDGYWCDSVDYLECSNRLITDLQFSGVLVICERQARRGLEPFELDIQYESDSANIPTNLAFRLGGRGGRKPFALATPEGPCNLQASADIYSGRPNFDLGWAVSLSFEPYLA